MKLEKIRLFRCKAGKRARMLFSDKGKEYSVLVDFDPTVIPVKKVIRHAREELRILLIFKGRVNSQRSKEKWRGR